MMRKRTKFPASTGRSYSCLAIIYCLILTGLASQASPVLAQKKKAVAVSNIRLELADKSTLKPGGRVTIRATPLDKNGLPVPGAINVEWRFATDTDGLFAALGQPVNSKAAHENTVVGLSPPEGTQDVPADITVRASVGDTFNDITVHYSAGLEAENSKITFTYLPSKPSQLVPGMSYDVTAEVKDAQGVTVPGAKVKWAPLAPDQKDFALLLKPVDDPTPNKITLIGRKGSAATTTGFITIAASYGTTFGTDTIPYADTAKAAPTPSPSPPPPPVAFDVIDADKSASEALDLAIEPGKRITLKTRARGTNAVGPPSVVWSVPEDMKPYIVKVSPEGDVASEQADFFGLLPKADMTRNINAVNTAPETISILVAEPKQTSAPKVVNIRNGAPEVDISWNILPTDVVTNNYGRKVSDNFYCIEVVVGNNSGNDLQLTGMGFDLPPTTANNSHSSNSNALPAISPYAGTRVPVASYEVVRGIVGQRRLAFNRGTLINGLDALAQFLTGFNPFFHVASRARNFAQGINILGNPITKGIERLWPDPYQDELNRLEQHTLHDDKIIGNRSVYKTRVFFPKDALYDKSTNSKPDSDNLMDIRSRLGQLVLVGQRLNRNDFQFRVRQGFGVEIR